MLTDIDWFALRVLGQLSLTPAFEGLSYIGLPNQSNTVYCRPIRVFDLVHTNHTLQWNSSKCFGLRTRVNHAYSFL